MVAETIYSMSPKILNETINKDKPTGSGRLALRKLLYAIVQHPLNEIDGYSYNNENANLGITGQPAELSLYLSLIKSEGIHKYNKKLGIYVFDKPKSENLQGMWKASEDFLRSCKYNKPLSDLYDIWSKPPYGIKQGVLPIYALIFMVINENKAGFYYKGTYQPRLNDIFVDYLSHSPNNISIRFFDSTGVHKNLLKLYSNLAQGFFGLTSEGNVLEVSKPIAKFVNGLPRYTKITKSLSRKTIKIRDVVAKSDDPIQLITTDLKTACGLKARWK